MKLCDSLLIDNADDLYFKLLVLMERAAAIHYMGKYKEAARTYEQLASLASVCGLTESTTCGFLLAASDNWRCYGQFLKSYMVFKRVRLFVKKNGNESKLAAKICLHELLLMRHFYQMAKMFCIKPLIERLQNRAKTLVSLAARVFLSSGSWFEWQQMSLWAQRYDLPPEVLRVQGAFETLPAREGYKHLGFPMAQMMILRDDIITGKLAADNATCRVISEKADLAQRIGLYTEAWKLHCILLTRFGLWRNRNIAKSFVHYFFKCEYAIFMRAILFVGNFLRSL